MRTSKSVGVVLEAFRAVEQRDEERQRDLFHPDAEFHWPPSLPYGGTLRGREIETRQVHTWEETWNPLQPTDAERRMDPRVVAATGEEVVVLWRQRGVDPAGERFDSPVLGLYQVRAGKLVRAQMFYFDPVAADRFLANAAHQAPAPSQETAAP
jgi:ketosteroid isomerase-like protein